MRSAQSFDIAHLVEPNTRFYAAAVVGIRTACRRFGPVSYVPAIESPVEMLPRMTLSHQRGAEP